MLWVHKQTEEESRLSLNLCHCPDCWWHFFLTLHWAVLLVYRVTWVKRNQLLCYLQTAARRADWHEIICLGTFAALHRSISTQTCSVCQSSWAQSRHSHKPNYLVTVEATLDSYWHAHLPAFLWMRFTVVRLYVTALPVSLSCSTGKQPRRIAIIAACCVYRMLQQSVKFFITSGRFHSNCLFIFTCLFEFFMVNFDHQCSNSVIHTLKTSILVVNKHKHNSQPMICDTRS